MSQQLFTAWTITELRSRLHTRRFHNRNALRFKAGCPTTRPRVVTSPWIDCRALQTLTTIQSRQTFGGDYQDEPRGKNFWRLSWLRKNISCIRYWTYTFCYCNGRSLGNITRYYRAENGEKDKAKYSFFKS